MVVQSNCLGCHCLRQQQTRKKIICGQLRESHLSEVHYPRAIFRVAFFWGGNYQYSIILWGNNLNSLCPRANYPGAVTGEAIFWGTIIRGATILGTTILGAIVREAIVRGAIIRGVTVRGQLSGGQLS